MGRNACPKDVQVAWTSVWVGGCRHMRPFGSVAGGNRGWCASTRLNGQTITTWSTCWFGGCTLVNFGATSWCAWSCVVLHLHAPGLELLPSRAFGPSPCGWFTRVADDRSLRSLGGRLSLCPQGALQGAVKGLRASVPRCAPPSGSRSMDTCGALDSRARLVGRTRRPSGSACGADDPVAYPGCEQVGAAPLKDHRESLCREVTMDAPTQDQVDGDELFTDDQWDDMVEFLEEERLRRAGL